MEKFNEKKMKKLTGVFKKNNVVFAYLFGSRATGNIIQNSDFDFAIMLPEKMSLTKRFDTRCKIISELTKILKDEKIETVVLNDTKSILFKFTIVKEGILIYEASHSIRVLFELKIANEFYDFSPFIEEYNKVYLERELAKIYRNNR